MGKDYRRYLIGVNSHALNFALSAIFYSRVIDGLPLEVVMGVGATDGQRPHVIHHKTGARAGIRPGGRAWLCGAEGANGRPRTGNAPARVSL